MPNQIISKISPAINTIHVEVTSKESPALYSSHTLKTFAQSLIGLFIPIYIFELANVPQITGNPLTDGILLILGFYLVRSIIALLLMNFITNTIFGFLNFKKSIFLGNVFLAIATILLALSSYSIIFLWISTLAFAIETSLYWIPYHLFFIRKASNSSGQYGHTFGTRVLLSQIASAAGPVLGGIIITYLGFGALFALGTVLIVASALPILFSVHEHNHGKHNARHIFEKHIKDRSLRNDSIAIAATEIDALLYSIFWPLLIFVAATSYAQVGVITSVSITISCLAALIIGNLVDKNGAKFIHKIGCTINSILYLPRLFLTSIQAFFILDIVDKLNGILYGVPFNAIMYEHARKRMHDSDFIIYRAVICHIAFIVTTAFTIGLVLVAPSWKYVFLLLAIVSPFAYLINRPSK